MPAVTDNRVALAITSFDFNGTAKGSSEIGFSWSSDSRQCATRSVRVVSGFQKVVIGIVW